MRQCLALILGVVLCGGAWAEPPLKIISLHYRFAQDVLPSVQPLVGPGGVVSAVGNNLLIRATPERIADIEQVVAMLDVERKTLRITVSRNRSTSAESREMGASGSVRRGGATVRTADRYGRVDSGVVVELGQRDSSVREQSSEFVSVMEGGRGVISVGQSVPFTETWVMLTQRYVQVQQAVQFHDISTGFSVTPHMIGDQVELEITPRIASLSGGVIEFQALATTVQFYPGEWFNLGGTMQIRDEVSREIFSNASSSGQSSSELWVRVE
jgi:hypothetical protein